MSAVDANTAREQADATNPRGSAWVSANAGSGKTFVLSRRVIRLLLAGVDPARILCLTFTKAAAAEMAKRVFADLGRWTTLSDAALAAEIAELEGRAPTADDVAAARRLFARALDTPGGLKIQTIHAFCERLLQQFPFEANVAGHFTVLDERDQRALAAEAQRAVLARAADDLDGDLGQALKRVLAVSSDRTHQESVAEFVDKRDQIHAWIVANDELEGAVADLKAWLAVGDDETVEVLRRQVTAAAPFDRADARRLVDLFRSGTSTDTAAAERLEAFAASDDEDLRIDAYVSFFRKDDGEFYKAIGTAGTRGRWPGLDATLEAEQVRLEALLDRIRAAEVFETSAAMLKLAFAAIGEYQRLKQARGALDFEDLVVNAVRLLARADASAWVHYKLDRGLDHILVDEAQDTSPRQWQVIERLAEEFFSGEGASDAVRTLFAVGDEKQSIFSFQGAVPAWFSLMRERIGASVDTKRYPWTRPKLHLSFRSVPVVLSAVDAVFARSEAFTGLSAEASPTDHAAFRHGQPGRVIYWPPIVKVQAEETRDWTTPVDYLGTESPEVQLAKRIAATARDWIGQPLDAPGDDGQPRRISAGSILVLVRSRGALTDAIIRELKAKRVAVAGADRLTLTEHIAVMDLLALGRTVLLPEDDLSLAALLKSPLIGLDEDALFALAHGRNGRQLRDVLWAQAGAREDFGRAKEKIGAWRALAEDRDPYAFFAHVLGPGGGRKAFLRRLGVEAEDVLDEFLAQALAFSRTNIPTLEGFIDWLVAGDTEIKRDTDTLRDEVRVMTVHGAKGLEADIVFLVDNGTAPHASGLHDAKLMSLRGEHDPDNPGPFVWMRSIKQMPESVRAVVENWRERAREEYRRLLYVGMTRARDRLVVCGIVKQNLQNDTRWQALVRNALEAEFTPAVAGDGAEVHEWRAAERDTATQVRPAEEKRPIDLPRWAETHVAPSAPVLRITPSTVAIDDDAEAADETWRPARSSLAELSDPKATMARDRGRIVHRLLQSLPDIDVARREEICARFVEAFAPKGWTEAERANLCGEVLAVMRDGRFAEAFAPGSRAEVDITGRIETSGGEAEVAGRIDRLAITESGVLVVDYKTNRPAPKTLAEAPPAYVAQLAVYRALLGRLYPNKTVRAALLWTDGPSLMPVPDDMLNRAESALAER